MKRINILNSEKRNDWTVIKDGEPIFYKGNKELTLICQCKCGKIKQISRRNFLYGMSKSCGCQRGKSISKSKTKYIESEIKGKIFNNLLAIKYVRTEKDKYKKDIWIFECLKCKKQKEYVLRDVIYGKSTSCGKCNLLYNINPNNIIEEWDYNKNVDLDIKNLTINSAKKAWWICKKCNHNWKTAIYNRTSNEGGCPKCNCSKGENKIASFLETHKIKFNTQKTFDNCKYKIKLKFDFYLPDYDLCIEYQGIQHYKPVQIWGGTNGFEKNKEKDKIKETFCKNNDIHLLSIPYWEYNNIEKILENLIYYNTVHYD